MDEVHLCIDLSSSLEFSTLSLSALLLVAFTASEAGPGCMEDAACPLSRLTDGIPNTQSALCTTHVPHLGFTSSHYW